MIYAPQLSVGSAFKMLSIDMLVPFLQLNLVVGLPPYPTILFFRYIQITTLVIVPNHGKNFFRQNILRIYIFHRPLPLFASLYQIIPAFR